MQDYTLLDYRFAQNVKLVDNSVLFMKPWYQCLTYAIWGKSSPDTFMVPDCTTKLCHWAQQHCLNILLCYWAPANVVAVVAVRVCTLRDKGSLKVLYGIQGFYLEPNGSKLCRKILQASWSFYIDLRGSIFLKSSKRYIIISNCTFMVLDQ